MGAAVLFFVPTKETVDKLRPLWYFVCTHKEKEAKTTGIKKGTKLTETPKNKTLKVRIDEETERRLEVVCEESARMKSEVVRDGINRQYAELQAPDKP